VRWPNSSSWPRGGVARLIKLTTNRGGQTHQVEHESAHEAGWQRIKLATRRDCQIHQVGREARVAKLIKLATSCHKAGAPPGPMRRSQSWRRWTGAGGAGHATKSKGVAYPDMEFHVWRWDPISGDMGFHVWIWRSISRQGNPYPDMERHIQIWSPISRCGIKYPDMEFHLQIWNPISRYGFSYPDMDSHIQIRPFISRFTMQYAAPTERAAGAAGAATTLKTLGKPLSFRLLTIANENPGMHWEIESQIKHFPSGLEYLDMEFHIRICNSISRYGFHINPKPGLVLKP